MSPQRTKDQTQKPGQGPRGALRSPVQPSAEALRAWRAVVRNGLI